MARRASAPISRSIASSASLVWAPVSIEEHADDAVEQPPAALQRGDGVGEGRRVRVRGDRIDLGVVLGKAALERRQEMLRRDRANGGTSKGRVQGSKNGLSARPARPDGFARSWLLYGGREPRHRQNAKTW